jgi:4-amino-4-deoxy-L-arabinose transferase-like glycosyltransferase
MSGTTKGARLLGAAVALLLGLRVHLLWTRVYDPDEFEHLHAAVSIASGQAPYRDFFEHHPPLTYWLSVPIVQAAGLSSHLPTLHRLVSLAFSVVCVAGVWGLGRTLYGPLPALWAALAMLTLPSFVEKQVEWRPDAVATALVPWAAWFFICPSRRRIRSDVAAGLLLGLATLATQKVLFLAAGMTLGAVLLRRRRGNGALAPLLASIAGSAAPWVLAAGALARQGALADAYRCLIETPMAWPIRTHGGDYLFGRTSWAPGHLALAVVGLGLAGSSALRDPRRPDGGVVLLTAVAFHAAGLLVIPAVYFQYYMLAVPLAAVVAVGAVWSALSPTPAPSPESSEDGPFPRRRPQAAALLAASYLLGAYLWRYSAGWPRDPYAAGDAVCLGGAVVVLLAVAVVGPRRAIPSAVLAALLASALGRLAVPHFYWPNQRQRELVQWVIDVVPPDQSVLDGFQGYGFLRPHASYWSWINEHTIPLIDQEGAWPELARIVADGEPALVIHDENLRRRISPNLLARRYVRVGGDFWLRRDLVDRAAPP